MDFFSDPFLNKIEIFTIEDEFVLPGHEGLSMLILEKCSMKIAFSCSLAENIIFFYWKNNVDPNQTCNKTIFHCVC